MERCFEYVKEAIRKSNDRNLNNPELSEEKLIKLLETCDMIDEFMAIHEIDECRALLDDRNGTVRIELFGGSIVFDSDDDNYMDIIKDSLAFGFQLEPGEDCLSAIFVYPNVWKE